MYEFMTGINQNFMYLLLIAGFFFLIKGADFFVDGSSSIAKLLRIPSIIIGLTVVAMGTSAPELAVSLTAAAKGQNEIAMSNVLGSNLLNLLFIVGICAVIAPIAVSRDILKRDLPISILSAILLFALGSNCFLGSSFSLGRLDGILLLIVFTAFLALCLKAALQFRQEDAAEPEKAKLSPLKSTAAVLIGIAGIIFGSDLVVDSATDIALTFGMSETLIGLTIIAFGTSLPELVTSVVAARKNENDLALGNIVGSNIFNILMILGLSSAITPIAVIPENLIDLILLILSSIIVWFLARDKKDMNRKDGIIMLILYAAYFIYIAVR